MNLPLEHTVIVTGHYGSGKTNLSLNLAAAYRKQGREVALADLDIVNPYFRSSEFEEFAGRQGIRLIASEYAGTGTNLDIPALSGRLDAQLEQDGVLIIDVGGDDAGAIALGRYAPRLENRPYAMLYVVNYYRPLMRDPEECAHLLTGIETVSRLRATHMINNSNLGGETRAEDVLRSMDYAHRVSELTGLPLLGTAAREDIAGEITGEVFPVQIYVNTPWNKVE